MNSDLLSALVSVLSSIGYQEDKELFAKKFIWVCEKQAFDTVVGKLPKDQQLALYGALNQEKPTDQSKSYIKTVLNSKIYENILVLTFQNNLQDYMHTVAPTLSQQQTEETERILKAM